MIPTDQVSRFKIQANEVIIIKKNILSFDK